MAEVRAVILDIDGTLIESNDAHARAFVDAAREQGFAAVEFYTQVKTVYTGD